MVDYLQDCIHIDTLYLPLRYISISANIEMRIDRQAYIIKCIILSYSHSCIALHALCSSFPKLLTMYPGTYLLTLYCFFPFFLFFAPVLLHHHLSPWAHPRHGLACSRGYASPSFVLDLTPFLSCFLVGAAL